MRTNRRKKKPRARQPRPAQRQLRIAIVGAGRLGTMLARALSDAGYRIDAVVTTRAASAKRAASLIRGNVAPLTSKQLSRSPKEVERLFEASVLIISTPDDAIQSVAQQLATLFATVSNKLSRRAKIALHTSGALSSEVLAPLRDSGFALGSLHPLVSVAGSMSVPDVFRGAYFCVEGEPSATRFARSIVKKLGGQSFSIDAESKPLYHAAAAMASGHVVALFDIACEMLERGGMPHRRAQRILLPLLESAAANLALKSPAEALTGPLARGDFATTQKHLEAMNENSLTEAANIYAALGKHALELARARGLNPRQLDRLARLLSSRTSRS